MEEEEEEECKVGSAPAIIQINSKITTSVSHQICATTLFVENSKLSCTFQIP